MRYYISDCHFFHGAMNEKMDRRGFSDTEEMNRVMIERWNSRVRKNDEVVILGDLSWGGATETALLLRELKGKSSSWRAITTASFPLPPSTATCISDGSLPTGR